MRGGGGEEYTELLVEVGHSGRRVANQVTNM